jgi:hypothetical protein
MAHGNAGRKRPDLSQRNKESAKHGMEGTPTYKSWSAMRDRCLTPTNKDYRNYGGRGISVDERWNSFERFLFDMGERPIGTTLGRKDNELGYSPENCRWETMDDQKNNKRTTRFVTINGATFPLKVWAQKLSMSHQTLRYRLAAGWSGASIIDLPMNHANRPERKFL